jgi:hypothetical protein
MTTQAHFLIQFQYFLVAPWKSKRIVSFFIEPR